MSEARESRQRSFNLDQLEHFREQRDPVRDALRIFLGEFFEREHVVDLDSVDTVLEVGSGTDSMFDDLPQNDFERYVEMDPNPEALQSSTSGDAVDTERASIYSNPFGSESFDLILGRNSYDKFVDFPGAMNRTVDLLKPGGQLVLFTDFFPGPRGEEAFLRDQGNVVMGTIDSEGRGLAYIPEQRLDELIESTDIEELPDDIPEATRRLDQFTQQLFEDVEYVSRMQLFEDFRGRIRDAIERHESLTPVEGTFESHPHKISPSDCYVEPGDYVRSSPLNLENCFFEEGYVDKTRSRADTYRKLSGLHIPGASLIEPDVIQDYTAEICILEKEN